MRKKHGMPYIRHIPKKTVLSCRNSQEIHIMHVDTFFYFNSLLFGVGLAVDAFLVALANGMNKGGTKAFKVTAVASAFSGFQLAAVFLGWAIAHTAFTYFSWMEQCFTWIAVSVIIVLGIKMIVGGASENGDKHLTELSIAAVLVQCAATSVDALTVGFTIEEYGLTAAFVCAVIIASVTFAAYASGFAVGKKFGLRFGKTATVIGGIVFFAIAAEIIISTYFL